LDRDAPVNLTGFITLLDAVRQARKRGTGVPVVFASSAEVYGDNGTVPLAEHERTSPVSAYSADKLGCELHARLAGIVHGISTIGLRLFNVYGPRAHAGSDYSGVIAVFSDLLASGRPLRIYGDGEQLRDFVHVSDVVRFLFTQCRRQWTDARSSTSAVARRFQFSLWHG
jgi:UDP-glucose 4-epimerase